MNLTMPWTSSKPANNGWTAPIEDVKQQIGQQVEHLVQVAAQVGHDVAQQATQVTNEAGSQAAGAARDLSTQAIKATQDASSQAADTARDLSSQALKVTAGAGSKAASVVRDVPSGANSLFQQILAGAAQFGREARAIRVTREPAPAQRGPDVIPGVALLAGVGGGLALMYFFDPGEGRRRRALLREQLTKWTRLGRQTAVGKAHDVRNRTVGLAHEARKAVTSRTGMDADMEEIASGSAAHTNGGAANGYSSTTEDAQPADQPLASEVG